MKKLIFVLLCTALLSSCKKTTTSNSYTPDCSGAAKSFATDVFPVVNGNCAGCHSKFSNYAGISGDASSIRSMIVSGSMPKNGSLTTAQKNAVVCWIDNGAPNN